jgi:RNA polymerase sigma-70 factor, ECF subfamily
MINSTAQAERTSAESQHGPSVEAVPQSTALVGRFVEMYGEQLLQGVQRMVPRDIAEDLVQETFLRALQRKKPLEEERAGGWLRTVASNLVRDWRRSKMNQSTTTLKYLSPKQQSAPCPEEAVDLQAPSPDTTLVQKDQYQAIETALQTLSEDNRAAVILDVFLGLKGAQIAETLGVTESGLRVRLHRAKKQLAAHVDLQNLRRTA